jgi:2-dehydro-3-deoxygluconokinase
MNKSDPGSVLCFGELLFRISQDANGDWLKDNTVPFYIGGAELNVALALALWDVPVEYVTALPPNDMSSQIARHLQNKGVATEYIYLHGSRVGLYYLTQGADVKNNSLIYDRAGSAFAELKTGMIDWDKVFDGISWFHFSAICPALNQNIADVCEEALIAASARNITISVDLNYRPRLWQYGKSPLQVMPGLLNYCTFIMGNIWAAETMLGISVDSNIHDIGEKNNYLKAALKSSRQLKERYPKCTAIANTFRFDAGDGIKYYTALYTAGEFITTTEHTAAKIINKVGSGDCFMAGLIYGFYKGLPPAETLDFATRAAFNKLFIKSDSTTSCVYDIKNPASR